MPDTSVSETRPLPVPARPARALPARRILRRFSHLLILTTLAAVPLAYPLHITEQLDFNLTRWVLSQDSTVLRDLWVNQIQPALFVGYSPLTLKRIVWAFLTLALGCTHLLWKFLPDRPADADSFRRVSLENILILGFTVWSGVSLYLWLPLSEEAGRPWGGFLKSLDAWTDLVIGVGFFFLTADLLRRRRWVSKGIGILFGTATLIATLAIGQREGWTTSFLTRWDFSDVNQLRNRMSSLIGHNTGVSSFLMTPVLLSLALGLTRWRRLRRPTSVLLGCFWILMVLTLTMAQSRAILPILLVAVPVLLWNLHRTSGLSPGRHAWTILAAGTALIILLQLIPGQWNPFYDRLIPLHRRIHDLSWERLRAETRLRIFFCSLPVIAQTPLQGRGFGSFQYVYPKAQGEYFQKHPETILVPTAKTTEQLHDEYLQTLLETGIVGLALAVLALVFILRRGWLAYSHTLRPDDIPIQLGILVSIFAILAHAWVDFPFRVPPIAVTLVWMLAVWNAGGKIWLPRRGRHLWPEDDDTLATPIAAPSFDIAAPETPFVMQPPAEGAADTVPPAAGRWVLWGILSALLVAGALVASAWYSRRLVTDVLGTRGDHNLSTYLTMRDAPAMDRIGVLRQARDVLRKGLRLRPVDGTLLLVKAFVEHYLAREFLAQARSAQDAGRSKDHDLWLTDSRSLARASLQSLDLAISEIRYHQIFHLRAENYRLLAQIDQRPEYLRRSQEELERAIAYTPAYPEAIVSLIQLLPQVSPGPNPRRHELLSLLYRWNPDFFFKAFVLEGTKAMEDERYQDAARIFKDLADSVPEDNQLLAFLASAFLKAGELDKAEAVLTDLAQMDPRPVLYDSLSAGIAIRRNQWQRALAHIGQALARSRGDSDYLQIMRYGVLEKLGEEDAARQGLTALERKAQRTPQVFVDLASVFVDQFQDTPRAIPYIQQLLKNPDRPVPPRLLFFLARWEYDQEHQQPEAVRLLQLALQKQPDHEPSRKLLERIRGDKSNSPGEGAAPAEALPKQKP